MNYSPNQTSDSGRPWGEPHLVYAAGVGVLWTIFVAIVAALYVALRVATGVRADAGTLALFLLADALIAGVIGWWLLRQARRWAGCGRAVTEVAGILFVWSVAAIGLLAVMAVVPAASMGAAVAALERRWPGLLADYAFFWAIAVSVVPIPFLKVWYDRLRAPPEAAQPITRIAIRNGVGDIFVPVEAIVAVTAAENYVELHTGDRSYLHRATMTQMEQILPGALFRRVHRGAIVRLDAVTAVSRPKANHVELTLSNGRTVGVGRAYRSSLLPALKTTVRHPD
jgi:two-component system LytT family response regulator